MKITSITIRREACISTAQFETARVAIEMTATTDDNESFEPVYRDLDEIVRNRLAESVDAVELGTRRQKSKAGRFTGV